jgi:hypothetical protein
MKMPRALGVLGIILLLMFPFVPALPLFIAYFIFRHGDASGMILPAFVPFMLAVFYAAVVQSSTMALDLRRPLLNPEGPWGILGPRKNPKPRLWGLLLWIALEAPTFALFAQAYREWGRTMRKHNAETVRIADELESFWIKQHQQEVAEAERWEKLAAECRAKDARGEAWTKVSWAERAKAHDMIAAKYRGMAARSAASLAGTQRQWAPLRRSAEGAR